MKHFAILAAAASALSATPAIADISSAKMISCEVAKGARCKNGTCQWRDASARDKEQILVLDLARKEALMRRQGQAAQDGRGRQRQGRERRPHRGSSSASPTPTRRTTWC